MQLIGTWIFQGIFASNGQGFLTLDSHNSLLAGHTRLNRNVESNRVAGYHPRIIGDPLGKVEGSCGESNGKASSKHQQWFSNVIYHGLWRRKSMENSRKRAKILAVSS
jgi:hypothetical protein